MQQLSYRIDWRRLLDRGYEFLIDGIPLTELVEVRKNSSYVPIGLAGDRCPGFPEFAKRHNRTIFSVCSCREWGCGVDDCQLTVGDQTVVFDDFCIWKKEDRPVHRFEFRRDNFDIVISELQSEGKKWRDYCERYVETKKSNDVAALQQVMLKELRDGLDRGEHQNRQVVQLIRRLLARMDQAAEKPFKNPVLPEYQLLHDGNAISELKKLLPS